jgi:hypothetical protein
MDNKTQKDLGFSMVEIDDNTILIEGIVQNKSSKKAKVKHERQFSKIALHLFDRDYIEKLQEIEFELVLEEKDTFEKLKEKLNQIAGRLLTE